MEKYAVYNHSFNGVVFYVGSGRIYEEEEGFVSRPYVFSGRSQEWYDFCNNNTDQVKVEILFETTDKQLARDREAGLTFYYDKLGYKLVNKRYGHYMTKEEKRKISLALKGANNPMYGKKHTKEARQRISESRKGENNPMWGKRGKDHPNYGKTAVNAKKVLMTNNKNGKQINFSNIQDAHEFMVEKGYPNKYNALKVRLRNGKFTFENYTLERLDKSNKEEK